MQNTSSQYRLSVDLRQKLHVSTWGCHRICKRYGMTQYRLVSICGRNCMCRLGVVIEFAKDTEYKDPIQTSVDLRQKLHVSTQGCRRICKRCKIHAPNTDQCRFAAETACVDLGLSQNLQKMQNTSTQYRVSICGRNCMCRLRVVIEFAKDVKYTHPIQTSVDLRQKLHVSTWGCHRICKRYGIQGPNTDQCRFAAETACVDLGLSQNLQKMQNTSSQYRLSVDLRQKLHVSTQGCHRICKRCRIQAPNTDQCRFAAETACVDLGLSQNLQKIQNTRTQYRLVSICGRNCMCRLRVVIEFAKDVKYTHPIQTSVDLRQKLHVSTWGCHRICKRYGIQGPNTDQCRFAAETACVDLGLSQNLQKM